MAEEARIVGRRVELATVDRAMARLEDGSAAMLYLVGEPGIGKTRLLAELQARAHGRRHLVLGGRAAEFERDLPFGLFVAALDDYLASLTTTTSWPPSGRPPPPAGGRAGRGLPVPRPPVEGDGAGLQEERYRAHRAVRALLEGLSVRRAGRPRPRRRPLGRRRLDRAALPPGRPPARWSRPPGPRHAAGGNIAPSRHRPRTGGPRRLGPPASPARSPFARRRPPLIGGAHRPPGLPGERRQPLLPATTGAGGPNVRIQRRLRPGRPGRAAGGAGRSRGGAGSPVGVRPQPAGGGGGVGRALRARRGRGRGGHGRRPGPRSPRRAGAPRPGPAHVGSPALPVPPPDRAARGLPGGRAGWRLTAHARLAEVLERQGASPQVRAHHVERSARPGDVAALDLLQEAGAAAAPRAPATAARWYQAALRLLPHDQIERRLGLLVVTATSLVSAGLLADARSTLLDVIDLLPPAMAAVRVRLIASCAALEHLLGRHRDAHGRLTSALGELADQGSPEAATLKLELAVDAIYTFDFPAMAAGRRPRPRTRPPSGPQRWRRPPWPSSASPSTSSAPPSRPPPTSTGPRPSSTGSPTPGWRPNSTPPTTCAGPRTSWSVMTPPWATRSGASPCRSRRGRATSSSRSCSDAPTPWSPGAGARRRANWPRWRRTRPGWRSTPSRCRGPCGCGPSPPPPPATTPSPCDRVRSAWPSAAPSTTTSSPPPAGGSSAPPSWRPASPSGAGPRS